MTLTLSDIQDSLYFFIQNNINLYRNHDHLYITPRTGSFNTAKLFILYYYDIRVNKDTDKI